MKGGQRTARTALELFAVSRLAIWALASVTLVLFASHRNPLRYRWDRPRLHDLGPAIDVWARWDSDWYVQIAQHGYVWPSSRPAFFPLYPLLVGPLGHAIGGHTVLAGVLVSLAACAGTFVLLDRLAALKLGEEAATRAVLFLAVFPTTLFLGAVYSESLFLLLSLAAFLLAERGRFGSAGLAGGLAALTRPGGLALVPALAVLAWRSPERGKALAGVAVTPALFALYPLMLWLWIGHPLAFLGAQKGIWQRHLSPWGPLGGFVEGVEQRAVKDLLVAAVLVALAVIAWRRVGAAYGVYALVSLALPLSWPSDTHALWSIARFGVVVFPIVLALAAVATTRLRTVAVAAVLAAFCIDSVVKWALWYWVACSSGISPVRLILWASFIAAVGILNFAARENGGQPDRDVLYQYSTAASGLVLYGVVLGVVLLLARGLDQREVFALRAPPSLLRATGWTLAGLAAVAAVNAALSPFLDAGKEQGLVPAGWQSQHAGAFVANFLVVAVVAPIVEELTFRGFGFSALSAVVGPAAVVLWVGIAFGVWHGLVVAFAALTALGAIFAFVRLKTRSVYPPMVMHAIFNAAALLVAVTFGVGS